MNASNINGIVCSMLSQGLPKMEKKGVLLSSCIYSSKRNTVKLTLKHNKIIAIKGS